MVNHSSLQISLCKLANLNMESRDAEAESNNPGSPVLSEGLLPKVLDC